MTHWQLCSWVALALTQPAVADGFGDIAIVRAIDELHAGNDAGALQLFDAALQAKRSGELWAEARFVAARTALSCGRPDRTLELLDGLDAEIPELGDFIIGMRARALRQLGQWYDGMATWRTLAGQFPDSPLVVEAIFGIGDAQYALGRLEEAKASYLTGIARAPRSRWTSTARFTIARIDEELELYPDAAGTYRFIAFLRPTDPLAEQAMLRFDALVAADKARAASFRTRLSRLDRLLSRHLLEQAAEALEDLEREATTPARQISVRYRRAQLAYRRRDFDAAIAAFGELIDQSAGLRQTEYKRWLARCYSASDQNDRAIDIYRELAGADPASTGGKEALFRSAWLAYNARQHIRAVKLFGEFVDRYPRDTATDEALWYLAWNAYRLGDLPTAGATLARIQSQFPRSSLVQRSLYWQGRIHQQRGTGDAAAAAFRAAVQEQPLSYYGAFAQRQLEALGSPTKTARRQGRMLASLAVVVGPGREPLPDELPESGGLRPLSPARLPWGNSVLDWDIPDGARALRMMKVGLHAHAARIVKRLPVVPGHDTETVAYARARILYAVGDYSGAYRIGATTFRDAMRERPDTTSRRYFHMAYPDAYRDAVWRAAGEFDVSPLVVLSVMRQESAFRTTARSWANAQGLMQIIEPTGRRIAEALGHEDFSVAELSDPSVSLRFGAWYLAQLQAKYHDCLPLALGAYNAGPKAVSRWVDAAGGMPTDAFIEEIPYRETRRYVKRVLGNLAVYTALYGAAPLAIRPTIPTDYLDNIDF